MRSSHALLALGVAALLVAAPWRFAGGQDVPRAARMPAAEAGALVGLVVDSLHRPIDGATIVVVGESRRDARTGPDGSFRIAALNEGRYQVRVRRIGFEPQIRRVDVGPRGASVVFTLATAVAAIEPIVSSVPRGGLTGIVKDLGSRPLASMHVQILGAGGQRASTDSAGAFFVPLSFGEYMVRISGPGFQPRLMSISIPRDSGRSIVVRMSTGTASGRRELIAQQELARRLAWRTALSSFFTREELTPFGARSLETVVRMAAANPLEDTCLAIVDGGPYTAPLWALDADELESVEVYPPGTLRLANGLTRERMMPFGEGPRGGARRVCPTVYVWRR